MMKSCSLGFYLRHILPDFVIVASVSVMVTSFSSSLSCDTRVELIPQLSLGIRIIGADVRALWRNGTDGAVSSAEGISSAVGKKVSNGSNALRSKRWYTTISPVVNNITHACPMHRALPCESRTRRNSANRQACIRYKPTSRCFNALG